MVRNLACLLLRQQQQRHSHRHVASGQILLRRLSHQNKCNDHALHLTAAIGTSTSHSPIGTNNRMDDPSTSIRNRSSSAMGRFASLAVGSAQRSAQHQCSFVGRDAPTGHHFLHSSGLPPPGQPQPYEPYRRTTRRSFHCTPHCSKVFVSRHNTSLNITAPLILENLSAASLIEQGTSDYRMTPTHIVLKECPLCSKPTNDRADNHYKLYMEIGSGAFFCHRCGTGGSWYDWKHKMGMGGKGNQEGMGGDPNSQSQQRWSHSNNQQASSPHMSTTGTGSPLPMPKQRTAALYSSRLLDGDGTTSTTGNISSKDSQVLDYLTTTRGLDRKTLRTYGVGCASYSFATKNDGYQPAECVTFPWILRQSEASAQDGNDDRYYDYQNKKEGNGSSFQAKKKPSSSSSLCSAAKKDDDKKNETESAKEEPEDPFVTRRIKVRAVDEKSWQRLDPAGGGWGLFGWHTVPKDATQIILTEGEYDAMAVHQATGLAAVSLPNGCRSLPVQVLPLLEELDKIILWMDNDAPGQEGAAKFAKKLGLNRCYVVSCRDAKDANEALLQGLDMKQLIDAAMPIPHERILTFQDLRRDVLHELLQPDQYSGVPIPSLPTFTKLIKGFRRGEMTVLTGATGSGKTTFLGQVSLDLAEQGINVMWGSFEIKNTRLLHKLLKQFSRKALPDHKAANAATVLDALADRFQELPLSFMSFHGGSEVDDVLDAMEYAVYVNDVEHVILDNMQFMISRNNISNRSFDKFDVQDVAIEKFRKFATEHNIHLTLVVHPRKEDETSKLNISSFYGSAKATQEADTVVILQHDGRRKYIEVKKNRFDGTLGHAPLYFQSASGRYVEDEGASSTFSPNNASQPVSARHHESKWKKNLAKHEAPEDPAEIERLENHWSGDGLFNPAT